MALLLEPDKLGYAQSKLAMTSKHPIIFRRCVFISFLSWFSAILALPFQERHIQTMALSAALNATSLDLLFASNVSVEELNAPSARGLDVHCNGARYGFNPSLDDCEGARSYIAPDSNKITFGERHTGLPDTTFPLPYMIMGGTSEEEENLIMIIV